MSFIPKPSMIESISTLANMTGDPKISSVASAVKKSGNASDKLSSVSKMTGIPNVSSLADVSKMTGDKLSSVPSVANVSRMASDKLSSVSKMTDVSKMSGIPNVSSLADVSKMTGDKLSSFPNVPSVSKMTGIPNVSSLADVSKMTGDKLSSVPSVPNLTNATKMASDNLSSVSKMTDVSKMTGIPSVPSVASLADVSKMDSDNLSSVPSVASLDDVSKISSVENFSKMDSDNLSSVQSVPSLADATKFSGFSNLTGIGDKSVINPTSSNTIDSDKSTEKKYNVNKSKKNILCKKLLNNNNYGIVLSTANTNFENEKMQDFDTSKWNTRKYFETFPFTSVLYQKQEPKIEDGVKKGEPKNISNINSKERPFIVEKRLEITGCIIEEFENNIIEEKIKKKRNMIKANLQIENQDKDDNDKAFETDKEMNKKLYNGVTQSVNILFVALGISAYLGSSTAGTIFSSLMSKWSQPFAGFIILLIIFSVGYGMSVSRSSGSGNTGSDNTMSFSNFFNNDFSYNFFSYYDNIATMVKNVNDGVKGLTGDIPDDIDRENEESSRGADNLYHFNGKDLNISNNVDTYNVNAVYSIYKPKDIIQKNFKIPWKKVKDGNNNESKYVLNCEGNEKYLENNCSVKIKKEIQPLEIKTEKEIYIQPIYLN